MSNLVIWKYRLPMSAREHAIAMPGGARILSVDTQYGQPCLWALVDPSAMTETRQFRIITTGSAEIENDAYQQGRLRYVGTVLLFAGEMVLHVFESFPFVEPAD